MRLLLVVGMAITFSLVVSTPVSAQFFLCEKTDDRGNIISPESPQYDLLEYDNDLVYVLQELTNLALIGIFLIGVLGSIYAAVKDTFYTPEGDESASKYVRMRSRLLVAGILVPILLIAGSLILEWLTKYETTCFVSVPLV